MQLLTSWAKRKLIFPQLYNPMCTTGKWATLSQLQSRLSDRCCTGVSNPWRNCTRFGLYVVYLTVPRLNLFRNILDGLAIAVVHSSEGKGVLLVIVDIARRVHLTLTTGLEANRVRFRSDCSRAVSEN